MLAVKNFNDFFTVSPWWLVVKNPHEKVVAQK